MCIAAVACKGIAARLCCRLCRQVGTRSYQFPYDLKAILVKVYVATVSEDF